VSAQPHTYDSVPALADSLSFELLRERDAVRLRPVGTLDLATEPLLEQQLAELRAAGFRDLIVDLRGLEFMDSTGLQLVLRWNAAARVDGFSIGFVPGSPMIQRVFELTGTTEHVSFIDPAGSLRR
jgi:anti-sigma B factor antagonist